MADIRAIGERLCELQAQVAALAHGNPDASRWAAEAKTDLQKGLMCLVRSVTRPEFF